MFKPTFEYVPDAPPAMAWDQYAQVVRTQWASLLNRPAVSEPDMQAFLEQHPSLLPAPIQAFDQGQGNPFSAAVLTQPELPGLKTRVPDFLYFTGNSGEITAALIEIESPGKQWFTSSGQPTAELTQAATQLTDWKDWFSEPSNVITFEKLYHVREYHPLNDRHFSQIYALVVGRRKDFRSPSARRKKAKLQRSGEHWMTYDRLKPDDAFADAVTVKLDRSGPDVQFRVLHVPPTLKFGPCHYPNYHKLVGLHAAIATNTLMAPDRKDFLLQRLPYWKEWYEQRPGVLCLSGRDFYGE